MAKLTLAGRSFEIAPYKLGALRQSAPHIDAINASSASIDTLEGMIANADHMLAIVAIGLKKIDSALTDDLLDDMVGAEDIPALGAAMREILTESGFVPRGSSGSFHAGSGGSLAEQLGDIVCELIAAGIEGGSKSRIEDEWGMDDVRAQRSYWERNGPPMYIAVQVIGRVLGIDWKQDDGTAEPSVDVAPIGLQGPSISEIASAAPLPGADLSQSSADILRQLGLS